MLKIGGVIAPQLCGQGQQMFANFKFVFFDSGY